MNAPVVSDILGWFSRRPLLCTLLAAALSTVLICYGRFSPDEVPPGDGYSYARGTFQLYGLLHSGQFEKFFDLLFSPEINTLPPGCILFAMVPKGLATLSTFSLLNCASWNIFLALGLYGILSELRRPGLAPVVMLVSVTNTYALEPSFFYHLDLAFMGCGMLVLWAQVAAWNRTRPSVSLLSGAGAGMMFFVKPGNALIFLMTWVLAEILHACWCARGDRRKAASGVKALWLGHAGYALAGLVPVVCLAFWWGALQTIVGLMHANQLSSGHETRMPDNIVLRAFYFPLCLSYFYSVLALGLVTVAAVIVHRWRRASGTTPVARMDPRVRAVLFAWIGSYLVAWGLIFSFVMTAKVLRSLLIMLPLIWIVLFLSPLFRGWRIRTLCWVALAWFGFAHYHSYTGLMPASGFNPDQYRFVGTWWNNWPQQKPLFTSLSGTLSREVVQVMREMGLDEGKVAVSNPPVYWDATTLNWFAQRDDLLAGRNPAIRFASMRAPDGRLVRKTVDGARGFALIVDPGYPYTSGGFEMAAGTADYAWMHWREKLGKISYLYSSVSLGKGGGKSPSCVAVVLHKPLQGKPLNEYVRNISPGGFAEDASPVSRIRSERVPLGECFKTLIQLLRDRYFSSGNPSPKNLN